MDKCFPKKKGECAPCRSRDECSTDKCWGHVGSDLRCVYDNPTSMAKCFPKKLECAGCSVAAQCSTHKCWGGKCVYDTPASMAKCFPVTISPPTHPPYPCRFKTTDHLSIGDPVPICP
ncbi:unnamed protein product [Chondrus crispus]|uniref:Uncharacterized protein n=1 Tax=Chondrus crispus TaxID=2769 RepID=R7QP44_CHOCR|nr:unnamed protein product [Chondrus crispus]CDF40272.1 unnamed protein product [Chondrus crispus]|eukprot:XP_005710566.1 unnamed protein product [Chondrus crispus]